jgi:hypothetical protein
MSERSNKKDMKNQFIELEEKINTHKNILSFDLNDYCNKTSY